MQKYSGMISRINPLALIFLQNEEEEEPAAVTPAQITNVHNHYYHTNYSIYNNVVNRYVHNYNQIVSLLRSNAIYSNSPNFKLDVHPVTFQHTQVQTPQETAAAVKQVTEHLLQEYVRVGKMQETKPEIQVKQLMEKVSADSLQILSGTTREKILSELSREVQEKILPLVQKEIINNEIISKQISQNEIPPKLLTKEIATVLQRSVKTVVEQQAGNLPKPVITQVAMKFSKELTVQLEKEMEKFSRSVFKETERTIEKQERVFTEREIEHRSEKPAEQQVEVIRDILIREIEPCVMAMSPGTSRSVIRQEIREVCRKERAVEVLLEELSQVAASENIRISTETNTVRIREILHSLIQKITKHTDTCRRGKERFEKQVFQRLMPLPVRSFPTQPVSFEFRREETENSIIQQKIVQIVNKEQTFESKFYTHLYDQFIKKTKAQKESDVDRSALPGGIIYHRKPKEKVFFRTRDVIQMPLEMLKQYPMIPAQEQVEQSEGTRQITDEIIKRVTDEIEKRVSVEAARKVNLEIVKSVNREIEQKISNEIERYSVDWKEPVLRRVIHKSLPEFTISVDSDKGAGFSGISYQAGYPELTLLVQEKQDSPVPQTIIQERDIAVPNLRAVTPIGLVHKQEEQVKGEEHHENTASSPRQNREQEIQPDIVFTEEIVTKENISQVMTEQIQTKQQMMAAGQSQLTMNGKNVPLQDAAGQNFFGATGYMPDAKVEQMISESVSRHMDENVKQISRQVYNTLSRQIKKEQERRGL